MNLKGNLLEEKCGVKPLLADRGDTICAHSQVVIDAAMHLPLSAASGAQDRREHP